MDSEQGIAIRRNTKIIGGASYSIIDPKYSNTVDKGFYGRGWNYVVDFDESPTIQRLYDEIALAPTCSNHDDMAKLTLVRDVVSGAYPIRSIPQVMDSVEKLKREKSSGQLSLEDFVNMGVGNCSQTALTVMLLVEKLRHNNLMAGEFRLDEAYWSNEFTSGGHTWGIYTAPDRKKTVVDIVREYLGDEEGYKKILKEVEEETLSDF